MFRVTFDTLYVKYNNGNCCHEQTTAIKPLLVGLWLQVTMLTQAFSKPQFEPLITFAERNKTIWCYACGEEVPLHYCDDDAILILNYAAFLHFAW